VALLHQAADDIAAHPAKADHAELHLEFPSLQYFVIPWRAICANLES